jgi:hypothetical protein
MTRFRRNDDALAADTGSYPHYIVLLHRIRDPRATVLTGTSQ